LTTFDWSVESSDRIRFGARLFFRNGLGLAFGR
jgi:hypothetical protein